MSPRGEVELDWAWYTAFGGAVFMLIGSVMRTPETTRARKPPGVL